MSKMIFAPVRSCGLLVFASVLVASTAAWAEATNAEGVCRYEVRGRCEVRVVRDWRADEAVMVRRQVKAPATVAQRRPETVVPTRYVDTAVEPSVTATQIAYSGPMPQRRPCLSPLCPGSITLGVAY